MNEFKTKGFWIRFLAFVIDLLVYEFIFGFIGIWITESNFLSFATVLPNFVVMYILFLLVLPWLFNSLILVLFGTTLGKILIFAKIIDIETGNKPSKIQLIKRSFGYIVSWFSLFLGFFAIGLNKRKFGFNDRFSGTTVVAKEFSIDEKSDYKVKLIKLDYFIISIFIISMMFNIYCLLIFSTDEKLTPLAKEWKFEEVIEEHPEENGFYWLIGINANKNDDQFQSGFDWVQNTNRDTKNIGIEGYEKQKHEYSESILDFNYAIEIGIIVDDSMDSNKLLQKNSTDISEIFKSVSYYEERLNKIQSMKTFTNTLIPTMTTPVPIYMNLVNYYRIKSAIARLNYLEGNYQEAITILDRSFNQAHFFLEHSTILIEKLVWYVIESILLDEISNLIEIETTPQLTKYIDQIEFLTLAKMSLVEPYKWEANMSIATIDMLMDSGEINQKYEKSIKKFAFSMFKPNHMLNLTCKKFNTVAELSTMRFIDFNNLINKDDTVLELTFSDYIKSPLGTLMLDVGVDIYQQYSIKLQLVNAKPILLKLKNKILSQNIEESSIQEFLNNQSKELYNPFTKKPVKWNTEKQRLEFELNFATEDDDYWLEVTR